MIRKPGKDSSQPDGWRPIALLSSIGKLLDSIVAHRLRDLSRQHCLSHATPKCVAGKCTTRALRTLLGLVYHVWSLRCVASLTSLDIKGAFDSVNRQMLFEAWTDKEIPDWLLQNLSSWLSGRHTALRVPGCSSQGPIPINVGIPQGSPISSILFHFFPAPMLERLANLNTRSSKQRALVLAFIDNTYLLNFSKKKDH